MARVLKTSLTGKDNESYDYVKLVTFFIVFVCTVLEIYEVVFNKKPFNITEYSMSMSGILLTSGITVKSKETTEPAPVKIKETPVTNLEKVPE